MQLCYKEQAHKMFEERQTTVTWIRVEGVEARGKGLAFFPRLIFQS